MSNPKWNGIGDDSKPEPKKKSTPKKKAEPKPEPTVDDPDVSLGSYVPKSIRDRLGKLAKKEGRKMRFLVEKALREYLDREEAKESE